MASSGCRVMWRRRRTSGPVVVAPPRPVDDAPRPAWLTAPDAWPPGQLVALDEVGRVVGADIDQMAQRAVLGGHAVIDDVIGGKWVSLPSALRLAADDAQ